MLSDGTVRVLDVLGDNIGMHHPAICDSLLHLKEEKMKRHHKDSK